MGLLTQNEKFLSISSSLGADELLLQAISGTEYISKPFQFHLELLSINKNIKAKDIIGQKVDFQIEVANDQPRIFNGYVSQFVAGPIHRNGYRIYNAEIVSWFTLLDLIQDCRIFQNMTASAIIEEVFNSRGYSDFDINVSRNLKEREYTVQYRETDFNFVSRLLEEEGIFYFFKHENGKHTMVIADDINAYGTCVDNHAHFYDGGRSDDQLTEWSNEYNIITGKWSQDDYNYLTPSTDVSTTVDTIVDLPGITDFEQYDYPGLYENRGDGDGLTKVRIEECETAHNVVSSAGTYRTFAAGSMFVLATHEIESEKDKEYVLTSVTHYARENSYDLGESGANEYSNSFTCIPSQVAYRPPQITRKPFVQGPQTAVVVGPSGEEIYTDEHGRVKVQFHWDRVGENNENSSCWVRVSQQWAGKQWGAFFLPRITHEVVVSFLEGDPDRPLVTGCVYNADNVPPYDLPAKKTQSGWKSRSTKEGGTANFNELRFDDLKGSEEIYIHAEKDQNNIVENDETTNVGNDRTEEVGNDETITIGNDRTETVRNNETITIEANRTESVQKDEKISIGANRVEDVGKDETVSIGANQSLQVGKDQTEDIGKALTLNVGDKRTTTIGKDDNLDVGKKLTIEAGDQITLKTGKASIVMKKNGEITISGKDINLKGSGKINVKASSNITIKGSKIAQN